MGSRHLDLLQTPSDSTKNKFSIFHSASHTSKKRFREDRDTSSSTVDSAKFVDYTKKIAILETEITKLKEDKERLVIEKDHVTKERKLSALHESEEEKSKRDRLLSQRNSLFEKNKELEEELERISEQYHGYYQEMSEKQNNMLSENSDLKSKVFELTATLKKDKRTFTQNSYEMESKYESAILEKDNAYSLLEKKCELKEKTIKMLEETVNSMKDDLENYNELRRSEFNLRIEVDALKNKEVLATVFPHKVFKAQAVEDENTRLVKDINHLREVKGNTDLLKIQLEDSEKEVESLKAKLHDYFSLKNNYEAIQKELQEWKVVKSTLNITSPYSITNTINKLQDDTIDMTKSIEEYKGEIKKLNTELKELRDENSLLSKRSTEQEGKLHQMSRKYHEVEVALETSKHDASSCRKLLQTYQKSTEEERQHLAKKPGVKILHMKLNPYQNELNKELQRTVEENKRLKQQLDASENQTLAKDLSVCQQKLADTEILLKKREKIFQNKVKEFKDIYKDMFGYSIKFPDDNQYSLLSLFAESSNDSILFVRERNSLQLIETDYSKTLDMQCHISKLSQHKSIPLFLADVTSDLFHRQTIFSTA